MRRTRFHFSPRPTPARRADPDFATLYGLYWLLVGLSQRAPLLVLVDDVHWVDVPSLRFLGFLARRVDGMRLLACGAVRPAEPGTDRALLSDLALGAETLRPRPLTPAGAGELIGAQLGTTPDSALVQQCLDATGGNPYYLHALARELAERGPGADVHELGSEGVSRLLLRRLIALGPGAPELAGALAILGDGATLGETARLAGLEPPAAATAAGALARAAIAEGVERLAFVHPIVRASIYGDVPPAVRATCTAAPRGSSPSTAPISTASPRNCCSRDCRAAGPSSVCARRRRARCAAARPRTRPTTCAARSMATAIPSCASRSSRSSPSPRPRSRTLRRSAISRRRWR